MALLAAISSAWCADAPCTATRISRAEARQLVLQVPEALALTRAGGKVESLDWHPDTAYTHADVFVYFLLQRSKLETLPLENPLIGYYAINLYSGRVLNFTTTQEVTGDALATLQAQLRAKHCISAQLVQENADITP